MKLRMLSVLIAALAEFAYGQNTAEVQAQPGMPIPPMNVPALTLPNGAGDAAGAGQAAAEQAQDPELEITAVAVDTSGIAGPEDERLKPFKSILEKLAKGAAFRVVSQESQVAPFKAESNWVVNEQYTVYVLPMEQTPEGAVRLDARVAMNSGGKSLNALRAEGEVPPRKVMAFRGLDAGNGNELLLFLRQAPGDHEDQSGGESGESSEQDESEPQESGSTQQGEQGEEDQDEQAEPQEAPKPEEQEESQMAKQEEQKDGEQETVGEQQDDQTIEALLQSLEEEDQRQQQEARFNRKNIIIPPNGDWW